MITQCLFTDPSKRPSAKELLVYIKFKNKLTKPMQMAENIN